MRLEITVVCRAEAKEYKAIVTPEIMAILWPETLGPIVSDSNFQEIVLTASGGMTITIRRASDPCDILPVSCIVVEEEK